jgi:hypothetical protein
MPAPIPAAATTSRPDRRPYLKQPKRFYPTAMTVGRIVFDTGALSS